MKKSVSIIVPMYKVEKYISKCLESLITQTYPNIVIYAVSDGSPDNSIEIAKKYSKKDKRIICIEKENGGYGSVLEYCISLIDTEYFLICDPDDWLEKECVELLIDKMEKEKLDICIGEKYLVYSDNEEKKYIGSTKGKIIKANIVLDNKNYNNLIYLDVSPHSKMFRTSICKKIIFPQKVSYTDKILFYCALNNSNRVMYIDIPISNYLIDRPGNTATEKSIKALDNELIVTNSLLNQIKINDNSSCILLALAIQYQYLLNLYYYFNNNEYKKSINDIYIKILNNKRIINNNIKNVSLKDRILINITFCKYTYWIIKSARFLMAKIRRNI